MFDCGNQQNNIYFNEHTNFYFSGVNSPGTFTYTLQTISGEDQLVVTNPSGDQAYYTKNTLSVDDVISNTIRIYPNPVSDFLTVKINQDEIKSIKVFSLLGKQILQTKSNRIDMRNVSKSVYLLQIVKYNGEEERFKIIKN